MVPTYDIWIISVTYGWQCYSPVVWIHRPDRVTGLQYLFGRGPERNHMDGTGDNASTGAAGRRSGPLTVTAAVLGKKWHPLILSVLLDASALGFNELKDRVHGISDKVLSESLDDLQKRDLVDRTVIDDKPVRVEYSLTEWGEQLELVITAMNEWGKRYLDAHGGEKAGE